MKKSLLLIFLFSIISYSVYSQKIVNDSQNNLIKTALNTLKKEIKKIDTKNLKTATETLKTVNGVLKETEKYIGMLEKVSKSIRKISTLNDIKNCQRRILEAYNKGKDIRKSIFLTKAEKTYYNKVFDHFFNDSRDILIDVNMLLADNKLKMFDGDRIILLDKSFKKISSIAGVAEFINKRFRSIIKQAKKDTQRMKEIEEYEKSYY